MDFFGTILSNARFQIETMDNPALKAEAVIALQHLEEHRPALERLGKERLRQFVGNIALEKDNKAQEIFGEALREQSEADKLIQTVQESAEIIQAQTQMEAEAKRAALQFAWQLGSQGARFLLPLLLA